MLSFIMFALVVIYVGGIWKFSTGFGRTNFDKTLVNRIMLASLWPALFMINPSYRRNFKKALKG
jgi:hypothetical protein